MIVDELYGLALWLENYVEPSLPLYDRLAGVLEVNASQAQKAAVKEPLESLEEALKEMPVERLTSEQRDLLITNETLHYIGIDGLNTFRRVIREGNFDPATSAREAREAHNKVSNLVRLFKTLRQDILGVGVIVQRPFTVEDGVVTRVHFRDKANIGNVVDLKEWSGEWHDIARGLAIAAGEKPEDVRVIGASTGSLIVVLATSLLVAGVLTVLAKRANTIAKNVIDIMNAIEDLRHKKVLNATIEEAMRKQAKTIQDSGVKESVDDIKQFLGKEISNEVEGQLKNAVKKYFEFTEKGGEVDMIAPPQMESDEQNGIAANIADLNASIEAVRQVKQANQMLLGNGDAK